MHQFDLLSGTGAGNVILAENVGSRQKPEWSEFRRLYVRKPSAP